MYKEFFILPLILVFSHGLNHWPTSFPRSENQNPNLFWSGMIIAALVALTTLKTTTKDVALSCDQTNEWKGFMQITFIMYHHYHTTYVYNSPRFTDLEKRGASFRSMVAKQPRETGLNRAGMSTLANFLRSKSHSIATRCPDVLSQKTGAFPIPSL